MGVYQGSEWAIQPVEATFTAVGQTTTPAAYQGWFNLFVGDAGNFTGSIGLEASYDGGVTWLPLTSAGTAVTFSARAVETLRQYEAGVLIRARCLTLSAGTIKVRLSQ